MVVIGAVAALSFSRRTPRPPRPVGPDSAGGVARSAGVVRMDSVIELRQQILRRIAQSSTYLPAMLTQSDSVLKRWTDRTVTPLVVYLPPGGASDYSPEMGDAVRAAF